MTAATVWGSDVEEPICDNLLVKLASRCNIACTYCYWFRDKTVYDAPPIMTEDVQAALIEKLERHLRRYRIREFGILFHGGEPMLFGKRRFRALAAAISEVARGTGCRMPLSIMTNGMLIDDDWIALFQEFEVRLGISIDGPETVHDRNRIDFKGRGTHSRAVAGIRKAQDAGISPGILAVCNPDDDPEKLVRYFVDDLDCPSFDILVPDATHEDDPASIASYYKALFDLWYGKYAERGVDVRYLSSILKGLLGGQSGSQVIGYGPVTSVTLLTDGGIEALDTLRIAGDGSTTSALNILGNDIQDIASDPLWREIHSASVNLAPVCESCEYKSTCGGGHIASRWSKTRRYDNPSVYCADIKDIIRHIWDEIAQDLYLEVDEKHYARMVDAIAQQKMAVSA